MNEQNDAQDQSPSAHDKDVKMMDSIRADRACIKCGFNLFGQEVFKEDHYQLAVTRCPECGTVAALQSYPMMSHWVNRFRALIAGGWVFGLLFVFILQMSFIGSIADGMSRTASEDFAIQIGEHYFSWAEENEVVVNGPFGAGVNQYPQWLNIPNDWADDHVDTIYNKMNGQSKQVINEMAWAFVPASIAMFLFGVFWSNALLGASRKKAAIIPVLAGVSAVLLMYFPDLNWGLSTTYVQASEIAKEYYSAYLAFFGVLIQLPALLLGVFLGRKIARWIITLTLPPRSRVPFSIFWTRDGLALPSAKR